MEVHSEALRRRWVAPLCSLAGLLSFLLVAGAGVLPLYVAWGSGPFWLRDVVRFEQPRVAFASRLVVQLSGTRGAGGAGAAQRVPFRATWTSSAVANALVDGAELRAMVVRASARDDNLDGLNDEVLLSAQLPLQGDEAVSAATLCAYFDAALSSTARMQMDALVVGSWSAGFAASRLDLDGDLALAQRQSLPAASAGTFAPFLGAPLPALELAASAADVQPAALLAAARGRNFSLRLDVPAPLWTPDASAAAAGGAAAAAGGAAADLSTVLGTQPRSFTVALRARVPAGAVWLRPKISEELRWGWMQYLSFLVLSSAVAWCFRWALFGLGIFETSVVVDAPRAASKLHLS
jgi:hypothetical protein